MKIMYVKNDNFWFVRFGVFDNYQNDGLADGETRIQFKNGVRSWSTKENGKLYTSDGKCTYRDPDYVPPKGFEHRCKLKVDKATPTINKMNDINYVLAAIDSLPNHMNIASKSVEI